VLHLDIAFHGSPRVTGPLFTSYPSTGPRGPSATTLLVLDGREEGRGATETHLEFARALLKELSPEARTEEFVRLWYDAVATQLAAARNFAELLVHLDHASRLFQSDPEIMFASGFLHETFAAPRLQAVVGAASGTGTFPGIGSVGHNLSEAEHYFRRAVSALPGFGEARLHLGRVLGLQGKHKLAVPELERALEDAEDSAQTYYALLFLGREEEMLGRREASSRHFERAAALFPSAQAPQLALSRLALERGNERGAQEILNRSLTAREGAASAMDPWWDYETTPGRHADRKLARMYRALQKEMK
jgi:tetratricopeptide (TPR) repeat protein